MPDAQRLLTFAKLYIEMRRAQKAYFSARRKKEAGIAELEASKKLEARVDKEAEAIVLGTVPGLFDAEVPE